MTNVLPLPAQQSLWRFERARFVIVLSLVLIALAAVTLLALIPSFAALEANTVSSAEQDAQGKTAAESLKSMTKSQQLLTVLAPLIAASSSPESAIEHALSLKPKGVSVQHIRFVNSSKQILLAGMAPRDALTAYRSALEADPAFTSVSVPVAALVGTTGQFSITLTGNF